MVELSVRSGRTVHMELFLSHATADTALVSTLAVKLQPLGVRLYATEHDGQAGVNVHDKIKDAIRRSDLVIVLLTEAGYMSNYVMQEIGFSQQTNRLTIPIVTPQT